MLKRLLLVVLALVLVALPVAVRWLYLFEGKYHPGEVNRPDLAAIAAPTPQMPSFLDRTQPTDAGTILVDLAHDNNLQMSELNVLKSRLSARSQRFEVVASADDLADQLRYAKALVSISPRKSWAASEVQAVKRFVDKGGRLLLVTDATRYEIVYDDLGDFVGLDHDAVHMNDLAGQFGVTFQPDYLYNTVDYESNYRNIKLTRMAASPLTKDVQQVVFYAARSILSRDPGLITTTAETRSSSSERTDELQVAVLTAAGQVLALGDLTFMTEPYDAVADNDRFTANIADFLSGAQRHYDLADFPFFFRDEVDLVYTSDPLLDSDLLTGGSSLQAAFEDNGRQLIVQESEDKARDTLFLGLYDQAEEVEPYLEDAQVTLVLTPTESSEEEATPPPAAEITATLEVTPEAENYVEIESVGQMVLTGTALLLLEPGDSRQVLVALSDTEIGLKDAVKRMADGDLSDCVLRSTESPTPTLLALCPTGEVEAGKGAGGWPKPETTPSPEKPGKADAEEGAPAEGEGKPKGSILIIALDTGKGRYDSLTGADDFATVLKQDYKVAIWSVKEDGLPGLSDCLANDVVVLAAGDYQDSFGDKEDQLLMQLLGEGEPVILSGAYIVSAENLSVQRDIQVSDAEHPIAKGFAAQEVISFIPAPSGTEYEIGVQKPPELGQEVGVPFVRGPKSEDIGSPAIQAFSDKEAELQLVRIGFPVYLLPDAAKSQLILNTIEWLLAP